MKKGIDKNTTSHGFWDEFISGAVFGLGILGIHFMQIYNGGADALYQYGLLGGLIAGQVLIGGIEASRVLQKYSKVIRLACVALSFANLLLFAFFPSRVGVGYLIGMGITFLLGMSLVALTKKLLNMKNS